MGQWNVINMYDLAALFQFGAHFLIEGLMSNTSGSPNPIIVPCECDIDKRPNYA